MPKRNFARDLDTQLHARLRESAVTQAELLAAAARRPDIVARAWANENSARNTIRRFLEERSGLNVRPRDALYALLDDVLSFRRDGTSAPVAPDPDPSSSNGSSAPSVLLEALPGLPALLEGGKLVVTIEFVPTPPEPADDALADAYLDLATVSADGVRAAVAGHDVPVHPHAA